MVPAVKEQDVSASPEKKRSLHEVVSTKKIPVSYSYCTMVEADYPKTLLLIYRRSLQISK